MSEDQYDNSRLMLCATKVIKPGPTRIGKLGKNVTLPRTVEIRQIVGFVLGALVLLIPAILVGVGLRELSLAAGIGGSAGVLATTWSPLKHESLAKWIGLSVEARLGGNRMMINGEACRVYIGICPVTHMPRGEVRLVRGAVDVPAGSVDDRGLPLDDHENRALLRDVGRAPIAKPAPLRIPDEPLPMPTELPRYKTRQNVPAPAMTAEQAAAAARPAPQSFPPPVQPRRPAARPAGPAPARHAGSPDPDAPLAPRPAPAPRSLRQVADETRRDR